MVERIVSNLRETRDIVLAAQSLVNEQFNANTTLLGFSKRENLFNQKLKILKKTIKSSTFLTPEEKKAFAKLTSVEAYQKAREIILQLTKKEIKNPLAK